MNSNDPPSDIHNLDLCDSRVLAEVVEKAMTRAVKQAIAEHHRAGDPVVIWRDGQVVLWYPDGSVQPVK
jgi:hypothetical protein